MPQHVIDIAPGISATITDEDREIATLRVESQGGPLTAAQLTATINALGLLRALMLPAFDPSPPMGTAGVLKSLDPAVGTGNLPDGTRTLNIRSVAFGWQLFMFTPEKWALFQQLIAGGAEKGTATLQ